MMARRLVAGGVLLAAIAVVAYLLLGGGAPYTLTLQTTNASQLVKGNLVQVAGTTVGKVKKISLAPDGEAQLKITVSDDYAPLRQGTRAIIRQRSLSGVANKYIDLQVGSGTGKKLASGSTVPGTDVESNVDLDQLFSVFEPDVRKALRDDIRGLADGTQGHGPESRAALYYLNPLLSASSRLFGELGRNDDLLERFVVKNAEFVTDVADKREQLAGLVNHFGTVSTALAGRDTQLADAIRRLPGFLRKSDSTFVNLRATLDDLDPLVSAAKPVVREARPLLRDLRPFARDARPTLRDLAKTIRRPGKDNDLVELLRAQPPVARAALDEVNANGATRESAFTALTKSLNRSTPKLAFGRPYAPELTGWFDDFSTTGAYDALGNFSRAGLALSAFTFTPLTGLIPVPPDLRSQLLAAGAKLGRNDRCPGSTERSIDGSNPFKPTPDYHCDSSIQPIGP